MYVNNGMSFKNGRLKVPFDGLYHIYSFVDMYIERPEFRESQTNNSIIHAIFKSNIKHLNNGLEEEELMASFRPYEVSRSEAQGMYPTYLSADVSLEAGDEVYIKVCKKKHIKFPRENIFGIHLL